MLQETDVGVRLVTTAAVDTSAQAVQRAFQPLTAPAYLLPGARLFSLKSGVFATFNGVSKDRNDLDVLMVAVEGFNGAVPFIANRNFVEQWVAVPASAPALAAVGAAVELKAAPARGIPPPSASLLHHRALDMLAAIESGIQPMSTVSYNGRKLVLLGAEPRSGSYVARDAATLALVHLPPRAAVTVVALRSPLQMHKAKASVSRQLTYKKQPLNPADPPEPTFLYNLGVKQAMVKAVDADPERCFRYFGVRPGERAGSPKDATAIGITVCGKEVEMWFHCDGSEGAGVFTNGTEVRLTGETVPLQPSKALRPYIAPLPQPTPGTSHTKWKNKKLTEKMCADMTFSSPYLARSGRIVLLDTSVAALESLGLRHGQIKAEEDGSLHAIVGVGRDFDGTLNVWSAVDGRPGLGIDRDGAEFVLYDLCSPRVVPSTARPILYRPLDKPKHVSLTFNFPYLFGKDQTKTVMVDADPVRCLALFGIAPGQRVDGRSTAIGMCIDDDKLHMFFHADGHRGCGMYGPDTSVTLEDVFVNVEPLASKTITLRPVKERADDPLQPKFWFLCGTQSTSPTHFDADPQRCKRYFDLVPGQRVDSRATVIGMRKVESESNEVMMFFLADGHNGAGTFSDGTDLAIDQDEPLDVQDPLFLDESKIFVVKTVAINPWDPPQLTFPAKFGVEATCVAWVDADKQRCQRYLGIAPGQRATNATFIGFRPNPNNPTILEQFWHADGNNGAGVYTVGDTLLLEDDIVVVLPQTPLGTRALIRHPANAHSGAVKVPKLSKKSEYKFTFPFLHKTAVVSADIDCLERLLGVKHGQVVILSGLLACIVGVAIDPRDKTKDVELFALVNGSDAMMVRPGTVMTVFDAFHKLSPAAGRQIVYKSAEISPAKPPQFTFSYKVGVSQTASFQMLDANRERCLHYFGMCPGQRVDGKSTAIGMKKAGPNSLVMMFHVDGSPGAGLYAEGTSLFVEDGEVINVQEISADAPAVAFRSRSSLADEDEAEDELYVPSTSDLMDDETPPDCDQFVPQYVSNLAAVEAVNRTGYDTARRHIGQLAQKLEAGGHPDGNMALFMMLTHLRHQVPLVSWFNPTKLVDGKPVVERMSEDVVMRTLFETQDGNGSKNTDARRGWEDSLFPGAYDGAQPVERPKYGLLNIFNDPRGPLVQNNQYGDCFFVFSPELRKHCTMTAFDSSGVSHRDCGVCTLFGGQGSVFSQFKDEGKEIETFARVASGRVPFASSDGTFYKELQIHGNVFFQQHITHIVVHNRYLTRIADLHLLFNFAKKNGAVLVTVRTLTRVCKMRTWSLDRLLREAQDRGIVDSIEQQGAQTCLLAGPQDRTARRVFRAILDESCRRDMIDIELKIRESRNAAWRSTKPRTTPASSSSSGEDPESAIRALLERAGGSGGMPDPAALARMLGGGGDGERPKCPTQ